MSWVSDQIDSARGWVTDQLVQRYLRGLVATVLGKMDNHKRWLSVLLLVAVLSARTFAAIPGDQPLEAFLPTFIDVLGASVTAANPEDLGMWGFVMVGWFRALEKWATGQPLE